MADIQILGKEVLSERKYKLENIHFQKPGGDGKLHDDENEVYYRPDAVTVLLVDRKACKVLFTRQFRLPAFLNGNETGYLIEACAGLIKEPESAEEAARREVCEETGYVVEELTRAGGVYSSPGGITEYLYLFVADYDSETKIRGGGGLANEEEQISLVEMSFEEVSKRLEKGQFHDAKTILLLQHFLLFC